MQIKTYQSLPREAAEISTQVFIEEQGFLREFDDIDAKALHVVIYLDGAAAATGRTFQEDNSSAVWHLGRIAVRKDYRGRGLGLAVVKALEEAAEKEGGRVFELSAQTQARRFYEKAGYTAQGGVYQDEHCPHIKMVKNMSGGNACVRRGAGMIGETVTVTIDRPLGTYHPEHPELYYSVNYGYIEGVIGGDGEEQDAYVLGVDVPVESFTGTVIAVIHRNDDVEEKWAVCPEGLFFTREEIMALVSFQEQYFDSSVMM